MRPGKVLTGAALLLAAMALNMGLYLLVPYIQLMINRNLARTKKPPKEVTRAIELPMPPPEKVREHEIKEIKTPSFKPPALQAARPAGSGLKIDLSIAGGEGLGLVSGGDRTGPIGSGSGQGKGDGLGTMIYEMGQTDTDARPIGPDPPLDYPPRAEREGVTGEVSLTFVVNESGLVEQISVLKEDPTGYGFGAAAIESARKIRFKPATYQKMSVRQRFRKSFRFVQ